MNAPYRYVDAKAVTARLDRLIKMPVYRMSSEAMRRYEKEYFGRRCAGSRKLVEQAQEVVPGGVQHNLAFNYPFPLAFAKAEGNRLYDVDGNEYFDFLQAGGPTVLGSNPPEIREKVVELLETCGPSTGLFHEYEYKIARKITELVPSVEKVRMFGSGTEACMGAIRVARLATKKKNIVKMGGAYHGWSDQLAYGIRIPGTKGLQSQGVPGFVFSHTQEFFPNDANDLERVLRANLLRGGTAAVLLEPIGPESGTRPVDFDFPAHCRRLCDNYGALLIFDEVVTGFRLCPGGAQEYFGAAPDLTVFGKVVAGGYPGAGALGGRAEYMKYLGAGLDEHGGKKALVGGTMTATPLSCCAGYYTICEIERTRAWEKAALMGNRLTDGLSKLIERKGLPFAAFNVGSICHLDTLGTMHFAIRWSRPWEIPRVLKETSLRKAEMQRYGAAYMAEGLVTLAGNRLYTSAAYTEEDIDAALAAFAHVFEHIEVVEHD
ncbi:MAG TPA: aminotransferase class III-fold pyridoxal phosphate-dependent enzyme [Clostridia bacterium]|nr:aminotransferase class III-fold pyridoxal phosphate-dependent enzyme [Clostridia bacterium]